MVRSTGPVGKMATDNRGNYRRDLGRKMDADGTVRPQRFYLGRDRTAAAIRYLKLSQLWDSVEKRWQRERLARPLVPGRVRAGESVLGNAVDLR